MQNPLGHRRIEHGIRGVDAHAAGVGAGVALADALVVLRGRQRKHVLTVAEAEEAEFVALEELLEEDVRLLLAQQRPLKQLLGGFDGRVARLADDHALAGVPTRRP